MSAMDARSVIEALGLVPLDREGGYFARTYTSPRVTDDGAVAASAIYYLLTAQDFSHLHRLSGDELYHFYAGDPVELVELFPDGSVAKTLLGSAILDGREVQHLVSAGTWQGSRLAPGGAWALLGTTMCPGYTDECYEHGERARLLQDYPAFAQEIARLTREDDAREGA